MKNRNLKICHVASIDITVRFLLMPQLKFLLGQGYDVHVVCSPGTLIGQIEREGVKVKTISITRKITPVKDLVSLMKLFLYFKKEQFDIVHTHAPKPGLLGQLAAKMAGVPVIINTVHGLYVTEDSPYAKKKFFIFMEKISAWCSTLIFSQNSEDVETMVREKIAPAGKIRYLGNGIDVTKFSPERFLHQDVIAKKKELGIKPELKIIGVVGRLVKEKGYLDLFEAAKIVLKKHPNTLFLAIGPHEPAKKDRFDAGIVKSYGIENNIMFLGQQNNIDQLYALMDMFVLPSHREGFPRSVIEAMAMQKPIVVTDIRGCREEIEHEKQGLMVPPKNPQKLAEAIIFLLENPVISSRLANEAKLKARREFDEALVFEKIGVAYRQLAQKRVKVCHVVTVDITAKFIVLGLLEYLQRENYDVSIVSSPGKWTPFLKKRGFLVHPVTMLRKISPFSDMVPLIKLYLFFRKEKFDIVHTHTPKAGVLGRIAARLAGVPVVVHTSHGFYTGIKIDPVVKAVILFAEKMAAYFCDLVTSQNQEDVTFAIKNHIVPEKKIKALLYGIDISRFNPARFGGDAIAKKKEELGIPQDKKIIGMVGRFVKEKGYLDLLEAFRVIKQQNPDAMLLLVAPPDREKPDALQYGIFKEYGIEKDIILLADKGEISDMEQIYPLMDMFVLPSHREGFPYSIMEASASGKPVVATDIRGCREAVENGKTGILVPPENPAKLALALLKLLDSPELMGQLGANGRKKAEKDFDEQIFFKAMEGEYTALMRKKIT